MKRFALRAMGCCLIGTIAPGCAAQPPAACASIIGDWSGVSACYDRAVAPGCSEEQVRFYVRPAQDGSSDQLSLTAEKRARGNYVPMGGAQIVCDPKSGSWRSDLATSQFRGSWSYRLKGEELVGELRILPGDKLIRHASLQRH